MEREGLAEPGCVGGLGREDEGHFRREDLE